MQRYVASYFHRPPFFRLRRVSDEKGRRRRPDYEKPDFEPVNFGQSLCPFSSAMHLFGIGSSKCPGMSQKSNGKYVPPFQMQTNLLFP